MSKQQNQIVLSAEQLQAIIAKAVAEAGVPQATSKAQPRATRKRRNRVFNQTLTAGASPDVANATGTGNGRKGRSKYTYGTAETPKANKGEAYDAYFHRLALAREQQLEKAIPGVTNVALVRHLAYSRREKARGVKNLTSDFRDMDNVPFTWVELPGRNAVIGNLTADQVKARLAGAGYSFSGKNAAWGTDSKGRPVHRIGRFSATGAARKALDAELEN